MNRLKGPEIKLPELRVPDFLLDLYYDLRERHLLPLVAVLVVAIVAVPIALGGSSGGGSAPPPDGAAAIPGSAPEGEGAAVVVARSAPGLRDYRRRLQHLVAKDPFKQQYVAAEEAGAVPATPGATGGETGSGEEGGATAPPEASPPAEPGGGEGGGGNPPATPELKYYSYAIDVRVVPVSANGVPSKAEPTVRRNLPELTMLPGRKTPAVVFIGPSADAKKAVVLVSNDVQAIFGDAVCVVGGDSCELLALEPGVPETFVYGGNERIFRIELLKIRLVTTDHLNKASFGETHKKGN
jgi:hypothetical protein